LLGHRHRAGDAAAHRASQLRPDGRAALLGPHAAIDALRQGAVQRHRIAFHADALARQQVRAFGCDFALGRAAMLLIGTRDESQSAAVGRQHARALAHHGFLRVLPRGLIAEQGLVRAEPAHQPRLRAAALEAAGGLLRVVGGGDAEVAARLHGDVLVGQHHAGLHRRIALGIQAHRGPRHRTARLGGATQGS